MIGARGARAADAAVRRAVGEAGDVRERAARRRSRATASSNSPVVDEVDRGRARERLARAAPSRARRRSRSHAFGFAAFSAAAVFASAASDGVEVWSTMSSNSPARATTSSQVRSAGRRVDQHAVRHQRGRLREPGRVPERADLAARLVARARAAVEALVRGRVQEERALHGPLGRARPPRGGTGIGSATLGASSPPGKSKRSDEARVDRERPRRSGRSRARRAGAISRAHEGAAHHAVRARLGAARRAQRAHHLGPAPRARASRSQLLGRVRDVAELVGVDLAEDRGRRRIAARSRISSAISSARALLARLAAGRRRGSGPSRRRAAGRRDAPSGVPIP